MDGIFQKRYIDKYGIDFLLSYSKVLTVNILEQNMNYVECLKYIFISNKLNEIILKYNLNINNLIEKKYSLTQLKRLEKLYRNYRKNEEVNSFLIKHPDFVYMLGEDDIYEAISSIRAYTSGSNIISNLKVLYPLLQDDKFILFINTCVCFFAKQYINKIFGFYNENKDVIKQLDLQDNKVREKVKIWVNIDAQIKTVEELNNINLIRRNILINNILDKYDEKNLIIMRMEIIKSLYNIQFYEFNCKIDNIRNVIKNYSIPLNLVEKVESICSILNLKTKEEFINYILEHENDIYILDEIEKMCKSICFKSIKEHLNIVKGQEIITLKGEPFTVLAHRIASLNNYNYGMYFKLKFDISQWDKHFDQHSIVSTSLINEYNFSLVPGRGAVLIFDNFETERILDMGIKDIYSTPNFYKYDLKNEKTKLLMFDQFISQTIFGYNEVVLKRYLNGQNIKPNGIFCLDHIKSRDFTAAQYFNVPIYQLKTKYYIDLMIEHLNYLLLQNDIDSYTIYLKQFLYSFIMYHSVIKKYISDDYLLSVIGNLIDQYSLIINQENKEDLLNKLNKLLSCMTSISKVKNEYGMPNDFCKNIEDIQIKIKKL